MHGSTRTAVRFRAALALGLLAPLLPGARAQELLAPDVDAALEAGLVRSLGQPYRSHGSLVTQVAHAPNGQLALSASWDGTVCLWSTADGSLVRELRTDDRVTWAGFLRGGELVVAARESGLVLWRTRDGERLQDLALEASVQRGCVPAKGGELLALNSLEGPVRRFVLNAEGTRLAEGGSLELEHDGMRTALAVSADGTRLAVGGAWGDFLELFDLRDGSRVLSLDLPDPVSSLCWTPDGGGLLVGAYTSLVRLDLASGEVAEGWRDLDFTVQGLSVAPDGKAVYLCDDGGTIHGWSLGTPETEVVLSAGEHRDVVPSTSVSPDGRQLLSGGHDGSVRFWDLTSGQACCHPEGPTNIPLALAWSADGRWLLSGCYDNSATLWDPQAGSLVAHLVGHEYAVVGVGFLGDTPVSVGSDARVLAWEGREPRASVVVPRAAGRPTCASFDREGLVVGTLGGQALRWAALEGDPRAVGDGQTWLAHASRRADGSWLVVDGGGQVSVVGDDGEPRSTFDLSSESGVLRVFPVGEASVLLQEGDGRVSLREITGGARRWALDPGEEGWTECVAASADGRLVAVVDQDGLALRDAVDGRVLARTGTPTRTFSLMAFAPDGQRLACAMEDGTLLVWDVARLLAR